MRLTKSDLHLIRRLLGNHYDRLEGDSTSRKIVERVWNIIDFAVTDGDYISDDNVTHQPKLSPSAKKQRNLPVNKDSNDINDLF